MPSWLSSTQYLCCWHLQLAFSIDFHEQEVSFVNISCWHSFFTFINTICLLLTSIGILSWFSWKRGLFCCHLLLAFLLNFHLRYLFCWRLLLAFFFIFINKRSFFLTYLVGMPSWLLNKSLLLTSPIGILFLTFMNKRCLLMVFPLSWYLWASGLFCWNLLMAFLLW